MYRIRWDLHKMKVLDITEIFIYQNSTSSWILISQHIRASPTYQNL